MSSVILGQEQSDVLQGGQITLYQLFETWIGSGQAAPASGVTIAITAATTPGGGTGTPVPATQSGILWVDDANYSYPWTVPAAAAPGDYLVTWTGTGGQDGATVLTYTQSLTVAAISSGLPAPGVYATPAQYMAWSGDTATPLSMVQVNLQRASEDLDRALMGAVYAVNASGQPTDAMVIDVFMRACCAQCQYLIADNDPAGMKRIYSQTSVAGVQASRAKDQQALAMPPLAPRALQILHTNGVLPSAVLIAW
jgi:hypothetical protein